MKHIVRLAALGLFLAVLALLFVRVSVQAQIGELSVTTIEPGTLSSTTGGTLTILGGGFTSTTTCRLVGYGLLASTYVNAGSLTAVVPPGVPAGVYTLEVANPGGTATSVSNAVTILAPTPVPQPTSLPSPGRPVLTIRNYRVQPSRPSLGQEFVLTMEVYNNGSRAGENTLAVFPGGTFVAVGEAGHTIGTLHINHTAVVTQVLRVPSNLPSGTYNVQANLSANDYEGTHYEYPQTIAVEILGTGTGSATGRPQIVVEASRADPRDVAPGDHFELQLVLTNHGTRTATGVAVGMGSGSVALPSDRGGVATVDRLRSGETATVTLALVMGEVQAAGRQSLPLSIDFSDGNGTPYAAQQTVGLEVNTDLSHRPQLILSAYRTTPESLAPGDRFTLQIDVTNVGGGLAERLTLTLGGASATAGGTSTSGTGGPFAPVGSSNVRFVPSVPAGETVSVVQSLVIDGSAAAGAYQLRVGLAFDDERGTRRTDEQIISLLVLNRPRFTFDLFQPVGPVEVGVSFVVPVEVINIGRRSVNVSTIELASDQLQIDDGSLYVGPLDSGMSGSLEAVAIAGEPGSAQATVVVHYLDDFNQPQVLTHTLTFDVAEPAPVEQQGLEVAPAQQESIWDKIGRFFKGLFGLGS